MAAQHALSVDVIDKNKHRIPEPARTMQKWQKLGYLQILLKRGWCAAGNSLITARCVLLNARFNNNYLRRASQSVKEAIKDGGAHNAVITRSIGRVNG